MKQKQKQLRNHSRNKKRGLYTRGRKRINDYLKATWRPEKKEEKVKVIPKSDFKIKVIKENIFKRFIKWIYECIFRRKM